MNHPKSKLGLKLTFYKILVFAIASLLLAVPAHASNEAGPYFTFTGSIDTFEDMELTNIDSDLGADVNMGREIGLGFNHSIGYQFRNSFSTELEFSYKGGDFKPSTEESATGLDGDMTTKSFLVNGIYSFNIREFYTPYIGYGVGLASHEASVKGYPERGHGTLAYQFKMGVDMEFSRKLSLLLGYRYFATDNPTFVKLFTAESSSHGIEAGVKFHFSN
jgi:opacity protein-like surface antigen